LRFIASSIGVCEAIVESDRLARASTDRRSIKAIRSLEKRAAEAQYDTGEVE
jgi:hypothetical protein